MPSAVPAGIRIAIDRGQSILAVSVEIEER